MNDGLTKENLLLIIPPALKQDPSIMALAAADAEVLAERIKEIDRVRLIPNIDGLDEAVLDILARDFKVDWWDPQYSIDEKRRTLKGSWRVHKILGTKAAVETAIRAIYPLSTVEEWFQYGGEPYHFRLRINITNDTIDSDKQRRVLDRLNFYKSLRSHNDGVTYIVEIVMPTETPGHLVFHRFTQNWAFSHFRGGIRFKGDADFGGDIRFDQSPPGIGFPRFTVSTHFANIKGGTPFDGTADFGGGLTFDQAYSSVKLPAMRISTAIGRHRERLTAATSERVKFSNRRGGLRFDGIPLFDGASSFDQDSGGVLFRRFQFGVLYSHTKGGVGFDGAASFDGGTTFNQSFCTISFPALRISAQVPEIKTAVSVPRFRTAAAFRNGERAEIPQMKTEATMGRYKGNLGGKVTLLRISAQVPEMKTAVSVPRFRTAAAFRNGERAEILQMKTEATMGRYRGRISGKVTLDNWTDFGGGSAAFDGETTFNAYFKQEEL